MKYNKKGIQLSEAFGAVLTIVLVAMLVIVGLILFTQINASMDTDGTAAVSNNETIAKPTATGITLATGSNAKNGVCGTITDIRNHTSGNVAVELTDITQVGCIVYNKTVLTNYSASIRVTYPYTYSAETAASNASNTSITQFGTYPALIGLVGTVIFLGIVIGVLVMSFVFGGKGKA